MSAIIFNRPFGPQCVFDCPRGRGQCAAEVKPSPGADWTNHGTDEKPTLNPSFNCVKGCGWHGYIVDGELRDAPSGVISGIHTCAGCSHPHLFKFAMQRDVEGRLGVKVEIESLRQTAQTGGA